VGSANNLYTRISFYYSLSSILRGLKRYKSHIFSALLKYGYSKFNFEILEYCDPKDLLLIREQYYLDLLKPEYNILKFAGSTLGKTHSEEVRANISNAFSKAKNPMFGKIRPEGAGRPSQKIEVLDIKNNITTKYESISETISALKVGRTTLFRQLSSKNPKPYKNQYIFKRLFTKLALSQNDLAQTNLMLNSSAPFKNSNLSAYLAGLIEGLGTFSIHDKKSKAIKYRPMIIIVFKKADLPLAEYLKNITNSGKIYIKSDRGYIL
jgi:LAGLIDADG endonuclease/NUMOD3 motif/GIY-YIG catalytic domain